MKLEQIWLNNGLRNFNYVVFCAQTREAIVVDPLDANRCLDVCQRHSLNVHTIVNTHDHGDHTGGNEAVRRATGAKIACHPQAQIKAKALLLKHGDHLALGQTGGLNIAHTPGHTASHICLLSATNPSWVLSGDTLFHAGIGNCWQQTGDAEHMYDTFQRVFAALDDDVRVYPGHDYIHKNLSFAFALEPDNEDIKRAIDVIPIEPDSPRYTTMGLERRINPFLRLHSKRIRLSVSERVPELRPDASDKQVFLALRELRNAF